MNGNSGQGAQSKQGGFEGGDGIKIRLGRPTTSASVNGEIRNKLIFEVLKAIASACTIPPSRSDVKHAQT